MIVLIDAIHFFMGHKVVFAMTTDNGSLFIDKNDA
jgi:hypothetical protein